VVDQGRFDGLARGLATGQLSRRTVLKSLAAGVFLGFTGTLGLGCSEGRKYKAGVQQYTDQPVEQAGDGQLVEQKGGAQPAATDSSPCQWIKIWIKAFIPRDIPGTPGLTVQAPEDSTETMLYGPAKGLNDCFLTDQRSFSSDIKAKARMHSEITVHLKNRTFIGGDEYNFCNKTTEVDCEDGGVECSKTGKVTGRKFYNHQASADEFAVSLEAQGNNPCFTTSPDIDYEGIITLKRREEGAKVDVSFSGMVDKFPAFEMYAADHKGRTVTLFQKMPASGNTPRNLYGDASESVSGSATFTCDCPPGHSPCHDPLLKIVRCCVDGVERCDPDGTGVCQCFTEGCGSM
jgi:hypothetical protein